MELSLCDQNLIFGQTAIPKNLLFMLSRFCYSTLRVQNSKTVLRAMPERAGDTNETMNTVRYLHLMRVSVSMMMSDNQQVSSLDREERSRSVMTRYCKAISGFRICGHTVRRTD
jgi:hypothetical protein